MAACFAETRGSSVPLGSGNRDYGCLKLSVLNSEKLRRLCISTLDKAAIFRVKILNALAFFKEV